jgi:hypothetical protein
MLQALLNGKLSSQQENSGPARTRNQARANRVLANL